MRGRLWLPGGGRQVKLLDRYRTGHAEIGSSAPLLDEYEHERANK